MASTTKSQSLKSCMRVEAVMRLSSSFFCASFMASFLIRRSQLEAMVANPLSNAGCATSIMRTAKPCAATDLRDAIPHLART